MICPAIDTKVTSPILCSSVQKHLAALVSATFSVWGFAPFDSKEQNVEHNRFAGCDCRRALGIGIVVGREK